MTYADILTLLRAGYTKDEIDAMEAPAAQQETQPETQPANPAPANPAPAAPAQAPAPEAQPAAPTPEAQPAAPTPEAQPAAPTQTPADPTQQILHQLTELVKSVQAQNRGAAEIRGNIIEPGAQAMDTLRSLGGIPAAPENK